MDRPVTAGRILGLALPALGVLAAPPLYLLLDTAVVGRLGAVELAALAAGATVFSMLTAQLTFLAYGTTARASRAFGRGDVKGAVTEGVQATWVAVFVGALLFALVQIFAGGITRLLAPTRTSRGPPPGGCASRRSESRSRSYPRPATAGCEECRTRGARSSTSSAALARLR